MADVARVVAGVLLLLGAGFGLVAALGVVRFPDAYTRLHAAGKAGTLGSVLCLLALAASAEGPGTALRALAGVFFFFLTTPVSTHLLARAALLAGTPADPSTQIDPDVRIDAAR